MSFSFILSSSNSFSFLFINILHVIDIMKLFKQYLNHRFIDIIIAIMISEIQLDFEENHLKQTHCLNHASIFAYLNIITNFIQSEILKNHVKEIDNFFINYFYSSIDLISRSSDDK